MSYGCGFAGRRWCGRLYRGDGDDYAAAVERRLLRLRTSSGGDGRDRFT